MTTIKNTNKSSIILATESLEEGNLVSFPTETVYGLGGDATNNLAIAKIFETKNRPEFNPLIIHFASFDQIEENCEINDDIKKLNDLFWPGPMTIILKKKKESKISNLASANLDTIGVIHFWDLLGSTRGVRGLESCISASFCFANVPERKYQL